MRAIAVDLDRALGDTRPLWEAWLSSAAGILGVDPGSLPADRATAAAELDSSASAGNWRTLLERFCEERAAVHLRRSAEANAALRALEAAGHPLGVFTDAPEALARVALAQLGALHLVETVAAGEGALEQLRLKYGADTLVASSADDLVRYAALYNRPCGAKGRR